MLRVNHAFRSPAILWRTAEAGTRKLLSTTSNNIKGCVSVSANVSNLTPGFVLVGSRHRSAKIGRHVMDIIKASNPQCVAVELCAARLRLVQLRLKLDRIPSARWDAASPAVRQQWQDVCDTVFLEEDLISAVQAAWELNVPVVACDTSQEKTREQFLSLHRHIKKQLTDAGLTEGGVEEYLHKREKEVRELKIHPPSLEREGVSSALARQLSEIPEFHFLRYLLTSKRMQAGWDLDQFSSFKLEHCMRAAEALEYAWTMHTRLHVLLGSDVEKIVASGLEFLAANQAINTFDDVLRLLGTDSDLIPNREIFKGRSQAEKLLIPQSYRIRVEQREKAMVQNFINLERKHKSVVAVVGCGHMEGIETEWAKKAKGQKRVQVTKRRRS